MVPLLFERQQHLTAEGAEDAEGNFGCAGFLRDLRGSILLFVVRSSREAPRSDSDRFSADQDKQSIQEAHGPSFVRTTTAFHRGGRGGRRGNLWLCEVFSATSATSAVQFFFLLLGRRAKLLAQILIGSRPIRTTSRFRKLMVPLLFERQLHFTAERRERGNFWLCEVFSATAATSAVQFFQSHDAAEATASSSRTRGITRFP